MLERVICMSVSSRSGPRWCSVAGRDEPQGGRLRVRADHRLHVAGVAAVFTAVGGVDGVVDVIAGLDEVDVPLDVTRANAGGVAGLRGAEPATGSPAPGADVEVGAGPDHPDQH